MKKITFLVIAIFFSLATVAAQESWKTFNSEMGKFSIDFFGDVSVSQVNNNNATTYKASFTNDKMVVLVNSSKHIETLDGRNDLLKSSLDIFVKSVDGTLIVYKEVETNGVKGLYATMSLEHGTYFLEYKIYLKGFYQYQFIIYSEKENYKQDIANRYFESFKMED